MQICICTTILLGHAFDNEIDESIVLDVEQKVLDVARLGDVKAGIATGRVVVSLDVEQRGVQARGRGEHGLQLAQLRRAQYGHLVRRVGAGARCRVGGDCGGGGGGCDRRCVVVVDQHRRHDVRVVHALDHVHREYLIVATQALAVVERDVVAARVRMEDGERLVAAAVDRVQLVFDGHDTGGERLRWWWWWWCVSRRLDAPFLSDTTVPFCEYIYIERDMIIMDSHYIERELVGVVGVRIGEVALDRRRIELVDVGGADAQLSAARQAERVEALAGAHVDEHVAAAARYLRHLAAHQVDQLARQVLVRRVVVAQLAVHARAEREHATVLHHFDISFRESERERDRHDMT